MTTLLDCLTETVQENGNADWEENVEVKNEHQQTNNDKNARLDFKHFGVGKCSRHKSVCHKEGPLERTDLFYAISKYEVIGEGDSDHERGH